MVSGLRERFEEREMEKENGGEGGMEGRVEEEKKACWRNACTGISSEAYMSVTIACVWERLK